MDLLHIGTSDDWLSLKQATQGYPDVEQVTDKLEGLLGSQNLSVVIERHYIDKDFRDSHSAYFSKRFHTPSNRCLRLHFFRGDCVSNNWIVEPDLEYLGYSVVSPIKPGGMGRTLEYPPILYPVPRVGTCMLKLVRKPSISWVGNTV